MTRSPSCRHKKAADAIGGGGSCGGSENRPEGFLLPSLPVGRSSRADHAAANAASASAVEHGVWSAHKANVLDLAGLRKRVGFDRRRSYEKPDGTVNFVKSGQAYAGDWQ